MAAVVLVAGAGAIVFAAFHRTGDAPSSEQRNPPATSTTAASASKSVVPSTTSTTAPAVPPAPQPSADDAASALVSSWATGNRARALTVATGQAVDTLFAAPYQSGLATDRGCSDGPSPETCSFGPLGGASPTDPLYSISVTQVPGGWYVSSVQILP